MIDLTNEKFGFWTVLEKTDQKSKSGDRLWRCVCKCGKERSVTGGSLRYGATKSCGCKKHQKGRKIKSGERYGYLVTIKIGPNDKHGHCHWYCLCDCGKTTITAADRLIRGQTKSCGCKRQRDRKLLKSYKGCGDITGRAWKKIRRSGNRRDIHFDLDIKDAWEIFLAQDKKCALSGIEIYFDEFNPNKNTASLDRIDSALGYTKDNIQWLHKHINIMKLNHNQKYLIYLCHRISNNERLKNNGVN